jgi:serine/threonine-protein phosphatase 2A regulatory subunit A
MIKQLATWDHFNSRISACYLLHVCYPHVVELDKQDILQLFQDLCKDDSPMVRRSAAENLGF